MKTEYIVIILLSFGLFFQTILIVVNSLYDTDPFLENTNNSEYEIDQSVSRLGDRYSLSTYLWADNRIVDSWTASENDTYQGESSPNYWFVRELNDSVKIAHYEKADSTWRVHRDKIKIPIPKHTKEN